MMSYPAARSISPGTVMPGNQRDFSLYIKKQPEQTAIFYKAAAVTIRKKAYNKKPIIFQMILVLIVLLSANSRHQATSRSH